MRGGFSDKNAAGGAERLSPEAEVLNAVEQMVRAAKTRAELLDAFKTYRASLKYKAGETSEVAELRDAFIRNFKDTEELLQEEAAAKDMSERPIVTRKAGIRGKLWAFDHLPKRGERVFVYSNGKPAEVEMREDVMPGKPISYTAAQFGAKDGVTTAVANFWAEPSKGGHDWVLMFETESGNVHPMSVQTEDDEGTILRPGN